MHTCMLALVNPGSLTIVGLQSTTCKEQTYHHVSAGHARLAAQSRADAAHLLIFTLADTTLAIVITKNQPTFPE
jgi:hypothetical protein